MDHGTSRPLRSHEPVPLTDVLISPSVSAYRLRFSAEPRLTPSLPLCHGGLSWTVHFRH